MATNGTQWTAERRRATDLRERYPHAAEPLALYLALLDAWVEAARLGAASPPEPARLVPWVVDEVVPAVVKAAEAAGPAALATAVRELVDVGPADALTAWLRGDGLPPVARFVARASLHPILATMDDDAVAAACAADPAPRDERHCPRCGGPPQLSWRDESGEALVRARRRLSCARCGHDWAFSASTCPSCGETAGSKRTFYAESRSDAPVVAQESRAERAQRGTDPGLASPGLTSEERARREGGALQAPGPARAERAQRGTAGTLPHLRVESCATCARYLIDVDRGSDPRAVPEVDELVAIPLDLYAGEHGLTKITSNLMGF